jgi:hypothetical protein
MECCNLAHGSLMMGKHAEEEFHALIMDTFDELYKVETKQLSAKSSIGVFVHFNIVLIVDRSDNQVHYFVNEVKCTQTTTLW